MNDTKYKIGLINMDEIDFHIISQAIADHLEKTSCIMVTDSVDTEVLDFIYDGNNLQTTPTARIGNIIDNIERSLFEAQTQSLSQWKEYCLYWPESQLKIGSVIIDLTDRERDITMELIKAQDTGCSRNMLLNKIWGYRPDLETHTLETHIYRLRQKIEKEPDSPTRLVTIDGGYKFV